MILRLTASLCFLAAAAWAQGAAVPFGGLTHDSSLPVELSADALSIDQNSASAEFTGNVIAGQGSLRIAAQALRVEYETKEGQQTGEVARMIASGGVTLTNGAEAAEAERAVYSVTDGSIAMTGSVILTQGGNALSGERLVINLDTGMARIEGRVRTVLRPNAE